MDSPWFCFILYFIPFLKLLSWNWCLHFIHLDSWRFPGSLRRMLIWAFSMFASCLRTISRIQTAFVVARQISHSPHSSTSQDSRLSAANPDRCNAQNLRGGGLPQVFHVPVHTGRKRFHVAPEKMAELQGRHSRKLMDERLWNNELAISLQLRFKLWIFRMPKNKQKTNPKFRSFWFKESPG